MGKAEGFLVWDFSGFANKIASMGCPFITVENSVVNIDNRITLSGSSMTVTKDGTELVYTGINWRGAGNNNVKQYVAVSDTMFYFNARGYYECRTELIYEKIGNKSYYGLVSSSGNSTMPYKELSEFPIYDVDDDSVEYRHLARINYPSPDNSLDYSRDCLFKVLSKDSQGNITSYERAFDDPNLTACSNVPTNKKITFDSDNYYSLSKNCLFFIDA